VFTIALGLFALVMDRFSMVVEKSRINSE
jgi:hypothetical protein